MISPSVSRSIDTHNAALSRCFADTALRRYRSVVPHLAANTSRSASDSALMYASNLSIPINYQTVMSVSTPFGDLHFLGAPQEFGMADNEVVATRRQRLLACITDKYGGKQAECVRKTGIHQGELSGLLKSKSFGEKKARTLEEKLGLPNLWLDGLDTKQEQDAVVADFAWVYAHSSERGKALLRSTIDAARTAYCIIEDKRQA